MAQSDTRFDALVTDVVMPGMTGPELADVLAARDPRMAILYLSGYTDAARLSGLSRPGVAFLPKPYDPQTLAARLYELIQAAASR